MKIRVKETAKPTMDMTPMSDMVFQLLAFFIMSFKILSPEGDFNVRMPLAERQGTVEPQEVNALRIQLRAAENGQLRNIKLGELDLGLDFARLRSEVISLLGDPGTTGDQGATGVKGEFEVELVCDYDLEYQSVIEAVTAVTGYRNRDGNIVRLIDKVKFSPPQRPAG